jgi:hypothetical protein
MPAGGVFFANSKKDYPAAAILNKAIAEQGKRKCGGVASRAALGRGASPP